MPFTTELAALYRRDLTRLAQELAAFPSQETLWATREGVTNSAGHLALHLEGNLREYIGRLLGKIPYQRDRHLEFTSPELQVEEVLARVQALPELIAGVIESLSEETLDAVYPEVVLGTSIVARQFLLHLLGHLNYHLGQIDYLRRILTEGSAITFAGL